MGLVKGLIMWVAIVAAVVLGMYIYDEMNSDKITLKVDGERIKEEVKKFLPFSEETPVEPSN